MEYEQQYLRAVDQHTSNRYEIPLFKSEPSEKADEATRSARLQNDDFEQNISMRWNFAFCTYGLLVFWSLFVMIFLFSSTSSDTLKITLITTTIGKIIALFYLVLRYLFPNK